MQDDDRHGGLARVLLPDVAEQLAQRCELAEVSDFADRHPGHTGAGVSIGQRRGPAADLGRAKGWTCGLECHGAGGS